MSQTLHKSDYMSVFWEITNWESPRLNLHFSVQVNWKLKTFTHFLELVKDETLPNQTYQSFSLKDYRVWYAIVETLWELWYPIGEYDSDSPLAMNFISEWIANCESELYSKDNCFYR